MRALPRPRQGVEPEVTLEVQQVAAGNVTDLLDLDRPQRALARTEAVDVVELRCDVQRCALVPLPSVDFHQLGFAHFVHGAMMARPLPDPERITDLMKPIVVVMGVTGVGKSTVGRLIAAALHAPFLDADDFHSDAAKAQMHAGIPLTDAERDPWLDRINRALHDDAATGAVLACSALTHAYRERLSAGLDDVRFVLLTGDPSSSPVGSRTGTAISPAPTCSPHSSPRSRFLPMRSRSTSARRPA